MNITFKITKNYSYGETCLLNNEPILDSNCLFTVSDVYTYEKTFEIYLDLPLFCNVASMLERIFASIKDFCPQLNREVSLNKRFTRTSLQSINAVAQFITGNETDLNFENDCPVFLCTTKQQSHDFTAPSPFFNSLDAYTKGIMEARCKMNNGTVNLIGCVGDEFEHVDFVADYFTKNGNAIELVFMGMMNKDVRYYKIELDTVKSADAIHFLNSTFEYALN